MDKLDTILCRVAAVLLLSGIFLSVALTQDGHASSARASGSMPSRPTAAPLSARDQEFLKRANAGNLAEIQLGQLAIQRAESAEVKAFGNRMIRDHTAANDGVKRLAAEHGITLPDQLPPEEKAEKDRLGNLRGAEFDSAYLAAMLKDHKRDLAEFRRESKTLNDPELKDLAVKQLPALQNHLKQAESILPDLRAQRGALPKPSAAIAKR